MIPGVAWPLLLPRVIFALGIGAAFVDVDIARRTYLVLMLLWAVLLVEGGADVEAGAGRAA